jgi:DNA polymerase-3 subunit gamma/tau
LSAGLRPYRVLARTYRPTRLSELIGQEALVRTLTNAFASGRVAHAFLLSGIRGVGKTTTARIIARALNCTGADGTGGPTPEPCGVCPSCVAIAEDRPLDVIEMDAATRTGIDDIREIVESVAYAPAASRFKVWIVDEVHMLSVNAWNGFLKTLEEPPPHAKFVFATTEIRKVPVTVLSRCQRFELRRVPAPVIATHLEAILAKEGVGAEPGALALIAAAAEGSVRDSLSLLDQAMALSDGPVTADIVQEMLGLGDRRRIVDLLEAALTGVPGAVLQRLDELHALGAEPVTVLHDLLALVHRAARVKAGADGGMRLVLGPELDERVTALAGRLGAAALARAWQMLLKGIEDVRSAPDAPAAAEMALLRLATAADLPPPEELARLLRDGGRAAVPAAPRPAPRAAPQVPAPSPPVARLVPLPAAPAVAPAPVVPAEPEGPPPASRPASFAALVERLREAGEQPLAAHLERGAHLIRYEPGRIELRAGPSLPRDAASRLGEAAQRLTGRRWLVVLAQDEGAPTLAEQRRAWRAQRLSALGEDAGVQRLLAAFPGAEIVDVRPARVHIGATDDGGRAGPAGDTAAGSEAERA